MVKYDEKDRINAEDVYKRVLEIVKE